MPYPEDVATLTPDSQLAVPTTVQVARRDGTVATQAVPSLDPITGVSADDAALFAQAYFMPDYAAKVATLSPAAYWRFSEGQDATTIADASGNGRTLTLTAGRKGLTAGVAGSKAGAGAFTGVEKAQTTAYAPLAAATTNRTIMGWLHVPNIGAVRTLFGTVNSAGAGTTTEHARAWIGPDGMLSWRQQQGVPGATSQLTSAAGVIQPGRWQHFAFRFALGSTTLRIYVDGAEVAVSTGLSQAIHANAAGFALGGYGSAASFVGSLDEVSVHEAVLDPADIADLATRNTLQPVFAVS